MPDSLGRERKLLELFIHCALARTQTDHSLPHAFVCVLFATEISSRPKVPSVSS